MLNRYFSDNRDIASHNFYEIDPCRKTIGGYLVSVALHLVTVADLPLKVIDGQSGVTQRLAGRNGDEC